MKCACVFEDREQPDFTGKPAVVIEECAYHACLRRDGARPDRRMTHEWHVAVNQFHDGKIGTKEWRRWMYDGKTLADEVPRMVIVLRMEREGKLSQTHRQCSVSPEEPVPDNHLTCCLGVECRKCPELLALDKAKLEPAQIDVAKAWTCAAHIMSEGGDVMNEGFLLTTDDRMYWDNLHANLAQSPGDKQP